MSVIVAAGAAGGGGGGSSYTGPGSGVFDVRTYGAKVDGQFVFSTIAAGSPTPSAGFAGWTSGDVGKPVLFHAAGASGGALLTSIASVDPVTHLATFANAAGTSVTNGACYYGTDDTGGWQGAIDACLAAGGGTVYQPAGISMIAGALQTSHASNALTYYAQLRIGSPPTAEPVSLVLLGDRPIDIQDADGTPAFKGKGSFLVSTSPGGSYSTHSTIPSMLGGPDISAGSFVPVGVSIKNLAVLVPANPGLTGVNLAKALHVPRLKDIYISSTGAWDVFTTQPTNPAAFGLILPAINNYGQIVADGVYIGGFYAGLMFGEWTNADHLNIIGCRVALSPAPDQAVSSRFGWVAVQRCSYGVAYVDYTGPGVSNVPAGVSGLPRTLVIDHLMSSMIASGQGWQNLVQSINDPTNVLHGKVSYFAQFGWSVSGATHLSITNLAA